MLYGMTSRLGWSGDPRPLWKLWDEFGIAQARMMGYWDPACPVKTGRDDVLATVYRREDRTLLALASWAAETVRVPLAVEFARLGLDPARTRLWAPRLEGFQDEALFTPGEPIPVAPGRGWLLWLGEQPGKLAPAAAPVDQP